MMYALIIKGKFYYGKIGVVIKCINNNDYYISFPEENLTTYFYKNELIISESKEKLEKLKLLL